MHSHLATNSSQVRSCVAFVFKLILILSLITRSPRSVVALDMGFNPVLLSIAREDGLLQVRAAGPLRANENRPLLLRTAPLGPPLAKAHVDCAGAFTAARAVAELTLAAAKADARMFNDDSTAANKGTRLLLYTITL
jgi:hypothetical protein